MSEPQGGFNVTQETIWMHCETEGTLFRIVWKKNNVIMCFEHEKRDIDFMVKFMKFHVRKCIITRFYMDLNDISTLWRWWRKSGNNQDVWESFRRGMMCFVLLFFLWFWLWLLISIIPNRVRCSFKKKCFSIKFGKKYIRAHYKIPLKMIAMLWRTWNFVECATAF